MSELAYRTIDKTRWGEGPWQHEPDKLQWIDDDTGLDRLIVRNRVGALCGYVGVGPDHPWHGRDCDADGPVEVTCHGGLTYADACQITDDESEGVCHVPEPGRPEDVWWFGFDCCHLGDLMPSEFIPELARYGQPARIEWQEYRTLEYVRAECESLARQLAEVDPKEGQGEDG